MRDGAGCSGIIIFWWGYPWTGSGKSMTDTAGTVPEGLPTERVRESIRMLDELGVEYNILTVVTARTAEHIQGNLSGICTQRLEVSAVYSLPGSFGREAGEPEYSLTPELYGGVSGKAVPYVG